MSLNIRLKDLELGQLSPECVVLVSRFSRGLRRYHGIELKMCDEYLLKSVAHHARRTDSIELKAIYRQLKQEITRSVFDSMQRST